MLVEIVSHLDTNSTFAPPPHVCHLRIFCFCFWINSQSNGFVCGRNAQLITVSSTLYQEDLFFLRQHAWPGRWKAPFRCLAPGLTLITVSVLFARSTFTGRNQSLWRSHYSKKCFLYFHHHNWFPLIGLTRSQPCGHFALSRTESGGHHTNRKCLRVDIFVAVRRSESDTTACCLLSKAVRIGRQKGNQTWQTGQWRHYHVPHVKEPLYEKCEHTVGIWDCDNSSSFWSHGGSWIGTGFKCDITIGLASLQEELESMTWDREVWADVHRPLRGKIQW